MGVELGGTTVLSLFYYIFKRPYDMQLHFHSFNIFMCLGNQSTGGKAAHTALPQTNNIADVRSLLTRFCNMCIRTFH